MDCTIGLCLFRSLGQDDLSLKVGRDDLSFEESAQLREKSRGRKRHRNRRRRNREEEEEATR